MIADSATIQCVKIPSMDKSHPCEMLVNETQWVSKKPPKASMTKTDEHQVPDHIVTVKALASCISEERWLQSAEARRVGGR
jgi:hypothetical protein